MKIISMDGLAYDDVTILATALKEKISGAEIAKLATLLEGAETKRQSGMEGKHEAWVLATLNFLHAHDIPVCNHDAKGVRQKHDKEIPERLALVTASIGELKRQRKAATRGEELAQDHLATAQVALEQATATIKNHENVFKAIEAKIKSGDCELADILEMVAGDPPADPAPAAAS